MNKHELEVSHSGRRDDVKSILSDSSLVNLEIIKHHKCPKTFFFFWPKSCFF